MKRERGHIAAKGLDVTHATLFCGRSAFPVSKDSAWQPRLGFGLIGNCRRLRMLDELKRMVVEQLGMLRANCSPDQTRLQDRIAASGGARTASTSPRCSACARAAPVSSCATASCWRAQLRRPAQRRRPRSHASVLGLVEESDLDFHVAGQHVADTVARHFVRPLESLDQRSSNSA